MDKILKMAVAIGIAAFVLFLVLEAGYFPLDEGLSLAAAWLGLSGESAPTAPIWGSLLKLIAEPSARGLGIISVMSGAVASALFTYLAGRLLFGADEQVEVYARESGIRYEKTVIVGAGLAGLAFVFTPGFLAAATRLSPLMVQLALAFGALALAGRGSESFSVRKLRTFFAGGLAMLGALEGMPGLMAPPLAVILCLKPSESRKEGVAPHLGLLALAAVAVMLFVLFGEGGTERCYKLARYYRRQIPSGLVFSGLAAFLAVGVAPLMALWQLCRTGRMRSDGACRKYLIGWAIAIFVMGVVSLFNLSGLADSAANRLVDQIIAEAKGKAAVVNEGMLDDAFAFRLPKETRAISLAHEHDPEYGKGLAEWVRSAGATARRTEDEKLREELAFAAEQGAGALLDEWKKRDEAGFKESVLLSRGYFPTLEKWREAVAAYGEIGKREPLKGYFRRLLGIVGNDFGCEAIERGATNEAWQVFGEVVDKVDDGNYSALLNLMELVEGGYRASSGRIVKIKRLKANQERMLKTQERAIRAIHASGRVYVDPARKAEFETRQRESIEKNGLSPRAKEFIEALRAAKDGPKEGLKAREAIRKALERGEVRVEDFGGELIHLDVALGDMKSAENDAYRVIKLDRGNPLANEVLANSCMERGDIAAAERYLRRSIERGGASLWGKNNFAMVLMRLGKAAEAEPYAREVAAAVPDNWHFRDTLAQVLKAAGKTEEAEKELVKARELAKKAGELEEFKKAVGK